jgi:outer membrane protein assembly factor BamB
VTALDAESGRERWQKTIDGDIFATPAIADGVAYVVSNEPAVVALDVRSGKERWRRGVGGESSPAIHDGVLYLGGDDQSLRAITAKTGDIEWSSPLGYAIESSATVSGDAVFLASGPTINALDADDGQTLWTHVTGDAISADLAVAGGMVFASSHDGYVYALAAPEKQVGDRALGVNSQRGVSLAGGR